MIEDLFSKYDAAVVDFVSTLTEYVDCLEKNENSAIESNGDSSGFASFNRFKKQLRRKYNGLKRDYETLDKEFRKIEPFLDVLANKYCELKTEARSRYDYWTSLREQYESTSDKEARGKLYSEQEAAHSRMGESYYALNSFLNLVNSAVWSEQYDALLTLQRKIRLHSNRVSSESDLIPTRITAMKDGVYDMIFGLVDRRKGMNDRIQRECETTEEEKTNKTGKNKIDNPYAGSLTETEKKSFVLDAHTFYRLICRKSSYTNEQFNKLYNEISEKLLSRPMKLEEIIDFCSTNDVPHFSDEELRSLLSTDERMEYEIAEKSVRDISSFNYVPKNAEIVSYLEEPPTRSKDGKDESVRATTSDVEFADPETIAKLEFKATKDYVSEEEDDSEEEDEEAEDDEDEQMYYDADSFYRFLDSKMLTGDYTNVQYNELYVAVSEVLVHTPLPRKRIDDTYADLGIPSITEEEWQKLFVRQETRRNKNRLGKTNANLKFRGSVLLEVKNENFSLRVDLYHNAGRAESLQIKNVLAETMIEFNRSFGIRKSGKRANFRLFCFDDRNHYLRYSSHDRGYSKASDNRNVSSMYVYFGRNNYADKLDLFRHEFVHSLTHHATSKLALPRMFMEGIPEYVISKLKNKSSADIVRNVPTRCLNSSLRSLMENSAKYELDYYVTGCALVAYLEDVRPNFIDNLLFSAHAARLRDSHLKVVLMLRELYELEKDALLKDVQWFKMHSTDYDRQIESSLV